MTFASLFAALSLMIQPAADAPRVETRQGPVIGRAVDGVDSFLGLPYAAPPVGALRWRPPQAAATWTDPRPAVDYGAICIQPPSNGDPGVGPLPMSEDCLTLNVWAPAERTRPLPVMVWIHGGGFNNGSGTAALYDGANLAKRGVVVVTVNYRLGRLGFFDHPALAAERPAHEAGGNYGMMDIVAALEWVRDNIGGFGGDAGNVTVFGESAGGAAVTRLMISPRARGLFHKAVVQSGLGRDEGAPLDRPSASGRPSLQDRGAAWAGQAGFANATAEALRAIPADRLLSPAPSFYGGDNLPIDGDGPFEPFAVYRRQLEGTKGARLVYDRYGEPMWIAAPLITGSDVVSVKAGPDPIGRLALNFRFGPDAAGRLAKASQAVDDQWLFMIGDRILADPHVYGDVSDELQLMGPFDEQTLADVLAAVEEGRKAAPFVPEDVMAAFEAGRQAPVPLILGTNSAEFWWVKPSEISPYGELDDDMTVDERVAFHQAYGGLDGYNAHVVSDLAFNEPVRALARLHAKAGNPTFLYRFDVVPDPRPEPHEGATHASERPYVFDNLHTSNWAMGARDQRAATAMADYWTTFAAAGDPNGQGRPVWPEFGREPDRLLEFTNDGPEAKPMPFKDRLDLIEAFYRRVR